MAILLWIFLSITILLWIAGWAVMARPRAVPVPATNASIPETKISIIIPARNEEENLAILLPSIKAQSIAPHEVIVVDDQSTDGTTSVAEKHDATVVSGQPLPDDWYGKPWACHQGAQNASGEWFLFLDADTEFEPGALSKLGHLTRDSESVHSIGPWHRVEHAYEQLSSIFNVVMVLGMNAFTLKGNDAEKVGLFGQSMLISREQYDAVGGHGKVRREVLENFALSRFLSEAGFRCRCYLGKGTLKMRMFSGGYGDLVAGWSKGFVSGAGYTPRSAMIGVSCWLSALIMMTISLTFLPIASPQVATVIAILYALGALQSVYLFRLVGGFWILGGLFFPIALIFYQSTFFRALLRKRSGETVKWKDREVG